MNQQSLGRLSFVCFKGICSPKYKLSHEYRYLMSQNLRYLLCRYFKHFLRYLYSLGHIINGYRLELYIQELPALCSLNYLFACCIIVRTLSRKLSSYFLRYCWLSLALVGLLLFIRCLLYNRSR